MPFEKLDPIRDVVSESLALEKEEHRHNLKLKDKSWSRKMADQVGIILSDEENAEDKEADK